MTKRMELLLIIAVATALVALLIFDTIDRPGGEPTFQKISSRTAPTGNVDNAINELLEDVAGEITLSADEDADADLVDDDSQAINAIGEAYVGNEF